MKKTTIKSIVLTFIAIITVVIFVTPLFLVFSGNYTEEDQKEYIKQQVELCLKEKQEILSKYDEKNQVLIADTRNQIDLLLNSYLNEGRIGIDNLAKEIKLFKTMGYICYLQVYDVVKKTNKADLFLAEIFNKNIGRVTLKTHETCERLLTELEVKLRENNTNLQIELGTLLEKYKGIPMSLDLKELNRATNQFITDGKKMGSLYGGVALGVIGETIFIKSTITMIKKLTQRVVLKMTNSTALVVADGPLPVGDIIAIVGWGWYAYDVYKLTKSVPKKIKKDLITNLENDYISLFKHTNHVLDTLDSNFKLN